MSYTEFNQQIESFKNYHQAILIDDLAHHSRGVLVSPANGITSEIVNSMLAHSGGHLFVSITPERASAFSLFPMSQVRPQNNLLNSSMKLCVSVEAREGVSTGISTHDRATTVSILGEEIPKSYKLVKPGHVFPIEVRKAGVLVKNALPEGALDLVKIAGFTEAAAFIDLLDCEGNFLTLAGQTALAEKLKLPIINLTTLVQYRLATESLVSRITEAKLPSKYGGDLRSIVYKSSIHSGEHIVLVKGEINADKPVLVRVQSESTFSDVFGGKISTSQIKLHNSLRAIRDEGSGVLLYLRSLKTGLLSKQLRNDKSSLTTTMREHGLGAQILHDLGISQIRLLTDSDKEFPSLAPYGISVVSKERIPAFEEESLMKSDCNCTPTYIKS